MFTALKRAAARFVMDLPKPIRARVVLLFAPSYFVGALAFVVHEGEVLLVQDVYRPGWGAPGGLLNRMELPEAAAVREIQEELGIRVTVAPAGFHTVEPDRRNVTSWMTAELVDPADRQRAKVQTYELLDSAWFPLADLPDDVHTETMIGLRGLGLIP